MSAFTRYGSLLDEPIIAAQPLRHVASSLGIAVTTVPTYQLAASVTAADLLCQHYQLSSVASTAGLGERASRALADIILCASTPTEPPGLIDDVQPRTLRLDAATGALIEKHYHWQRAHLTDTDFTTSAHLVTALVSADPETTLIAASWAARCEHEPPTHHRRM